MHVCVDVIAADDGLKGFLYVTPPPARTDGLPPWMTRVNFRGRCCLYVRRLKLPLLPKQLMGDESIERSSSVDIAAFVASCGGVNGRGVTSGVLGEEVVGEEFGEGPSFGNETLSEGMSEVMAVSMLKLS